MSNQQVAGTIMLNGENGVKKFLVKKINDHYEFVVGRISDEKTSLACILQELKTSVKVNVAEIELVELTNINWNDKKVPLFVFEMDTTISADPIIASEYVWETPATLRDVLGSFNVTGVPIFQ